jgi:hypothetical protein
MDQKPLELMRAETQAMSEFAHTLKKEYRLGIPPVQHCVAASTQCILGLASIVL